MFISDMEPDIALDPAPDPRVLEVRTFIINKVKQRYGWFVVDTTTDPVTEHFDCAREFKKPETALQNGKGWLKQYGSSDNYGRRLMLGWRRDPDDPEPKVLEPTPQAPATPQLGTEAESTI